LNETATCAGLRAAAKTAASGGVLNMVKSVWGL